MSMTDEIHTMKLIQGNLAKLPSAESRRRVLGYLLEHASDEVAGPAPKVDPRQTRMFDEGEEER